jgi:hypothetical protein
MEIGPELKVTHESRFFTGLDGRQRVVRHVKNPCRFGVRNFDDVECNYMGFN